MHRICIFVPLRIERLLRRHFVRECNLVGKRAVFIPPCKRVSFTRGMRRLVNPRRRYRSYRSSLTDVERHRIFLRGFRLGLFCLFIISINVDVFRQRFVGICICRQLTLPFSVIEKPALERIIIFFRGRRQHQAFAPGCFYGTDHDAFGVKGYRIFRRNGRFVKNIMCIDADVFSQCLFGKPVLCKPVVPYAFVRIPPLERKPFFMRRIGQPDFFIARRLYRVDECFVIVKRYCIFLRSSRFRAAGGKNTENQSKAHHHA